MANPVVLNNETHRNIRVNVSRGAAFGENVHLVPVLATELRSLVLDYPVCLIKDPDTGQFGLSALLGFEPGENLYLQDDRWAAGYVPLNVRRQPFVLGFTAGEGNGSGPKKAVIAIDMDSKRIQQSGGEALFRQDGSNTPFLDNIQNQLAEIASGMEPTEALISALAENDLIEPAQLNIMFAGGEEKRYEGLYTVNQDKLGELTGEALEQLHGKGYLQASYLIITSMGQVKKLIDWKNARR